MFIILLEEYMQQELDTIKFESRAEIREVGLALSEYMQRHPEKAKEGPVKELFSKLDYMDMIW